MIPQKNYVDVLPNNNGKNKNALEDISHMVKESAGNVDIYKCKKCPYITLSNKDIDFHWQAHHIPLQTENKKDERKIRIKCPGCSGIFHLERSLMVHLRSHHKMAPKDIPKLTLGLIKQAEREKEYIENLDVVVIGNFKCENQVPFNGTIIPSVIEVPPDPTQSDLNIQHFNQQQEEPCILNLSNNILDYKQYENLIPFEESDIDSCKQISQEIFVSHETQNDEILLVRGNQCSVDVPVLDDNIVHDLAPDVSKSSSNEKSLKKCIKPSKKKQSKIVKKVSTREKKSLDSINNNNNNNEQGESPPSYQKCNFQGCTAKLVSKEKMQYHKSSHIDNTREMFCPECGKHCASVESLHSHLWTLHRVDLELPSCDICSYKTFKLSRLNNVHKKIHSDEKAFTCSICLKAFKNSKQLSNHKRLHKDNGSMKFVCNICDREVKNKRQLIAHKRVVHDKETHFRCNQCEYSAANKSSLVLHTKSHSDDKPFECEHCAYKTSILGSLRRHLQIHTQDKKYSCEHCTYNCIQATSMKNHILSKHPGVQSNLLNQCPFCSYKSVNKANFTTHLSSHTTGEISHKSSLSDDVFQDEETFNTESPIEMGIHHISNIDDNNELPKTNTAHFFYSNIHETEFMLDSDSNKTNLDNVNDIVQDDFSADNHSFGSGKCVTPSLLQQDVNDLYFHFPQESSQIDIDKSINMHMNSPTNNLKTLLQSSPSSIQMIKDPAFPIVLVKPKSQICPESDRVDTLNVKSFTEQTSTPQLINLPMNNHNETALNDGLPRKKPKISVKNNLILKGPDNTDSFNLQPQCKSLTNEFPILNMPFLINKQNRSMQYPSTADTEPPNENEISVSKLISRDPFMSDNSVLPNYLLTSNFFCNLRVPDISDDTQLVHLPSENSLNKSQNVGTSSIPTVTEVNHSTDLSDNIKLENKPYIPPQSELSCMSLNDNASGSGSLIYEVPKHTIPIKFERKPDIFSSYSYQEELFDDNLNDINQMQSVSIIEELPASFENSNGIIENQDSEPFTDNPYSDNFVDMLDENEIIIVDDTSCEMKSIPNFSEDSNFSFAGSEPFYNYHIQSTPNSLISHLEGVEVNGKHVKEKPRILSEVHILNDKSKNTNINVVKNLGLKLEFPSIHNIEWTLALLNEQNEG